MKSLVLNKVDLSQDGVNSETCNATLAKLCNQVDERSNQLNRVCVYLKQKSWCRNRKYQMH